MSKDAMKREDVEALRESLNAEAHRLLTDHHEDNRVRRFLLRVVDYFKRTPVATEAELRELWDELTEARSQRDTQRNIAQANLAAYNGISRRMADGWVMCSQRMPDHLHVVLAWADDTSEGDEEGPYIDGWEELAWWANGQWYDTATGKKRESEQPITMWHEIAGRPSDEQQMAARVSAHPDAAQREGA